MKLSTKVSTLALAMSAIGSQTALAAADVWDSADPWGTSVLSDYAGWNVFTDDDTVTAGIQDTTPQFGTSAASIEETTGAGFLISSQNIYSFSVPTSFVAELSGTATGFYDVYLRIATIGNDPLTTASLNGVNATAVTAFSEAAAQGTEQELYWKWSNVAGATSYTFDFGTAAAHASLDQVSLATVAAVPEPETYAMFLAGVGLMGFIGRRRIKS